MGLLQNTSPQVDRAFLLIEELEKKHHLSFDEGLIFCRALLTVAAHDEDFSSDNPENGGYSPVDDMYDQLERALHVLNQCPEPSTPTQIVEYSYLKATILLKYNEYNEALSLLKICQSTLERIPIDFNLKSIQDNLPEMLKLCEVICKRINTPQFQPPHYYEERSYMHAILREEQENYVFEPNLMLQRLAACSLFSIEEFKNLAPGELDYASHLERCYLQSQQQAHPNSAFSFYDEDQLFIANKEGALIHQSLPKDQKRNSKSLFLHVHYKEQCYEVEIFSTELSARLDLLRLRHPLSKRDKKAIFEAKHGISVVLKCSDKAFDSYKLQLLLIKTMVPHLLAVIDESAEQILCGSWVEFSSKIEAPLPSSMLYTIHAVADENDVWLHTHGLARFGAPEVEILNCSPQYFKQYHQFMHALCATALDNPQACHIYAPFVLASVADGSPIIATFVPWYEALQLYKDADIHGNIMDRIYDHNSRSYATFVYSDIEGYKKKQLHPLSCYDDQIDDDLLIVVSEEEHERQRLLAAETFPLVLRFFKSVPQTTVLVEIALEFSERYKDKDSDESQYEPVWCNLQRQEDENSCTVQVINDPYYIEDLHAGALLQCQKNTITDWQVQCPSIRGVIKAESAYRLKQYLNFLAFESANKSRLKANA